jgi:uncharacterized cupin superfamily protein
MAIAKNLRLITICFLTFVATLVAVAGAHLLSTKRGYTDFLAKPGKAERIELRAAPIDPSWIISGSPVCRSTVFDLSHDQSSKSGIWECRGASKFVWHYGVDESIYILEGEAHLEYLGNKFTLTPGDSTHFAAGTKATWVVNEHVRKTFRLYEPGRLVKVMRRIVR